MSQGKPESARRFDVLVLGAGIQGATAACEASRRGLSVLVVERGDFGAATSSHSMKIAHGGLRYLQSLDLRRSLESIRERRRLLRLAPHLVTPLACEVDLGGRGAAYRALLRAGLLANQMVSWRGNHGVRNDRRLPRAPFPLWYDALIEDTEALLLSFLHSAVEANPDGVEVHNHTRLESLRREGNRVVSARIEGLGEIEVGCVLSCVGAHREGRPTGVSMNLVFDRLPLHRGDRALALRHPVEGRNVFVVPWRERSIVGTWDRPQPADPTGPFRIEPGWIDEFLAWIAPVHPELSRLGRDDVRFVHAGRLPWGGDGPSEESQVVTSDGVIEVTGVKWTTAYGVSRRAVDAAVRLLGRGGPAPPDDPLVDVGAWRERVVAEDPALGERLLEGHALRRGDVHFALAHQWARNLGDVLLRRTGVAATGHPGRRLAEAVAAYMQERLGWSDGTRRDQLEAFNQSFEFAGNLPD